MDINKITEVVIGCAIKVHKELGPGLLESAYKECPYFELIQYGLIVEKEKALPLIYSEVKLDIGFCISSCIRQLAFLTTEFSELHRELNYSS